MLQRTVPGRRKVAKRLDDLMTISNFEAKRLEIVKGDLVKIEDLITISNFEANQRSLKERNKMTGYRLITCCCSKFSIKLET